MAKYHFKMPDIGEGVVEAEITAWHVSAGEMVLEDAPIADAMTDKATIELTSPVDGTVLKLGCELGDKIAVGADLIIFEVEGDMDLPAPQTPLEEPQTPLEEPQTPLEEPQTPLEAPKKNKLSKPAAASPLPPRTSTPPSGKVLAAPAVRQRAKKAGIDLAQVPASGSAGQITGADLARFEKALASPPETPAETPAETPSRPGETRIKIIGMRRLIAARMAASKRHIPHFTYVEEMEVTELDALRARLNAKYQDGPDNARPKLTVLPFIIRAMVMAFENGWPQMNAHFMDEAGYLAQFTPVHLGIATQTDQGLMVPVIKNVQTLNIWQIASEIIRLADGARAGSLSKDELTGATTTLTSLGPLGGVVTTPIINRPEVAIFGPNKIRPKLVMENGAVKETLVMNFSISCDHRIIDGYDAAAMMQYIKGLLGDPLSMFL